MIEALKLSLEKTEMFINSLFPYGCSKIPISTINGEKECEYLNYKYVGAIDCYNNFSFRYYVGEKDRNIFEFEFLSSSQIDSHDIFMNLFGMVKVFFPRSTYYVPESYSHIFKCIIE